MRGGDPGSPAEKHFSMIDEVIALAEATAADGSVPTDRSFTNANSAAAAVECWPELGSVLCYASQAAAHAILAAGHADPVGTGGLNFYSPYPASLLQSVRLEAAAAASAAITAVCDAFDRSVGLSVLSQIRRDIEGIRSTEAKLLVMASASFWPNGCPTINQSELASIWPNGCPFDPVLARRGRDVSEVRSELLKSTEDIQLWRYMKLPRFEQLLSTRMLHFTRADRFTDEKEGTYPPRSKWRISPNDAGALRQIVLVNCWHMNENENSRMWTEYATRDKGIAIRSSLHRLTVATWPHPDEIARQFYSTKQGIGGGFDDVFRPTFRGVEYTDVNDYEPDPRNLFGHFFVKSPEFAWEKELRARIIVAQRNAEGAFDLSIRPTFDHGMDVPVDIGRLIQEVIVGPSCCPEMQNEVERLCHRNGLMVKVTQSGLAM